MGSKWDDRILDSLARRNAELENPPVGVGWVSGPEAAKLRAERDEAQAERDALCEELIGALADLATARADLSVVSAALHSLAGRCVIDAPGYGCRVHRTILRAPGRDGPSKYPPGLSAILDGDWFVFGTEGEAVAAVLGASGDGVGKVVGANERG